MQEELLVGAATYIEAAEHSTPACDYPGTSHVTIGFEKVLEVGSGDAQNYQNVILGGIDKNGNQVYNEVSELILDIVEELHISDYPVAVRINKETQDNVLRRIAEIQRIGGGIVSI